MVRRFPRGVYGGGEEPDPRFSLANERTFLAWIRSTLAFLAGAVALEALGIPEHSALRHTAVLVLLATSLVLALQAWFGWVRTERALRHSQPLPAPLSILPVATGLVLVTLLVGLGLLLMRIG